MRGDVWLCYWGRRRLVARLVGPRTSLRRLVCGGIVYFCRLLIPVFVISHGQQISSSSCLLEFFLFIVFKSMLQFQEAGENNVPQRNPANIPE